ncbi:nuclear transport factor 2 family protein [bacterium]|nr:nuclear transport factor 2 family protein [bacterium]
MTLLTALVPGTAAAGAPEERVAAFHQALLDGDIEAVKGMLAEDLLLFEDGQAETSLKHYAEGHLKDDIAFSAESKRKLEWQTSWIEDNTATVSSTYDLKTKYKGKCYHLKTAETMTLKQTDGQWVIVHIHWSNHRVKE